MGSDSSIARWQNWMMGGPIPAIVLAAGKSSRMGRSKALLPLGSDETFLSRIVATLAAAGVDDVVVVVGHDAQSIVEDAARRGVRARFVENRAYESGQLTSLVAGLNVVDRPGLMATLVTLVDVPLVAPATVRAVVERYLAARPLVVRPARGGEHGHPTLIDRRLFDSLRGADPDRGAREIVRAHSTADSDVAVDDAGAFADVDTPVDYQNAIRMSGSSDGDRRPGGAGS
jgi:molybdenum cofactor cytidylyltransferase